MSLLSLKAPKLGLGIRPHPWLLWVLLVVLIAEALSGGIWTVLVSIMEEEGPALRPLAQIHGGFAFLSLIVVGTLNPQHMRFAWAARRNRGSGAVMLLIMFLLALTGKNNKNNTQTKQDLVRLAHIVVGIAAVSMLPLHLILGRKTRPKRHVHGHY